jgi:hypothetical protein
VPGGTFATLYEGDLKDLQATLGHSKIETTMKLYKKAISERQLASAGRCDPLIAVTPDVAGGGISWKSSTRAGHPNCG